MSLCVDLTSFQATAPGLGWSLRTTIITIQSWCVSVSWWSPTCSTDTLQLHTPHSATLRQVSIVCGTLLRNTGCKSFIKLNPKLIITIITVTFSFFSNSPGEYSSKEALDAVLYFTEEPSSDLAPKAPPLIVSIATVTSVRCNLAHMGHGISSTEPTNDTAVPIGGGSHTGRRLLNRHYYDLIWRWWEALQGETISAEIH